MWASKKPGQTKLKFFTFFMSNFKRRSAYFISTTPCHPAFLRLVFQPLISMQTGF